MAGPLSPQLDSAAFTDGLSPGMTATATPLGCPRRGSERSRALAGRCLALIGWRVEGELPAVPRFVVIVAPHTSNWDFPICVLVMFTVGLQATWLGKHTLFHFPVAGLLRWLGGEPIDRRAPHGTVGVAIERFRSRAQWVLAVSPEGTRKRVSHWKSGFHRIARGVGVPILPVELDYSRRVVTIDSLFEPTDDAEGDIATLRRRFSPEMALYPAKFAAVPHFQDSGAGRIFPLIPPDNPAAPMRSS